MNADIPYKPIDCGLYDYLEVACLYGYDIELELRDGTTVRGIAKTTRIDGDAEFLMIEIGTGTELIRLDRLARLVVKNSDRKFDSVSFA